MARVVVLVFTAEMRSWLAETGSALRPRFVSTIHALHDALRSAVYDAAIIGVRDTVGVPTTLLVHTLREQYSHLRIIACVEGQRQSEWADDLRLVVAIGRAGADDVIINGFDTYATVYGRIRENQCHLFVRDQVLQATSRRLCGNGNVRRFLEYSLVHARQPLTVLSIAESLQIPRRTLARQCQRAGLPKPQDLLSWSRLLVASALLEQSASSADVIGRSMFSSPSAFRTMLRRYTGLRSRELRDAGGFKVALQAFCSSLDAQCPSTTRNNAQ